MGITITIATDKALVHLRRAFHSWAEVDRRFLTASYSSAATPTRMALMIVAPVIVETWPTLKAFPGSQ
jgi:hypothetical protein